MNEIRRHYDLLIEEGNDPVNDPPVLRAYMDKWDGKPFLDALGLTGTEDVLEIGVGTGRLAVRVLTECAAFTGIDLSGKTIEKAESHLSEIGGNYSLICGDFMTWETDETYDVIYSSLTFLHIRDKSAAVKKTASLLKPGGRFVQSTDKNPAEVINTGTRKIEIFPDSRDVIDTCIKSAGLTLAECFETEFAVIYIAEKSSLQDRIGGDNMNDIKLGVIGTNFVSDWLCDSAAVSDGIVNHAVYSRTQEKGAEFAAKHNIPHVYTDMEAFLSSDIDAVYIASPNFLHYPYAKNAILHGKHVLLEKPATLNTSQFDELQKLARENGVVLIEAMRPEHDPAMELVRESMTKIGTIRRAVFDFCQYSSRYDKFRAGEILNAFNPAYGNGALMDIGCYALHACVMLFGEPESVYAKSVKLHNGVEGMGTVFLDYGAFQAEVVYSKITESYNPSVITGEDGDVLIGKLSMMESVALHRRGEEKQNLLDNREGNNMVYEIADFVKMIRGEMTADACNRNTRITLTIMDDIRRQNGIEFPHEEL